MVEQENLEQAIQRVGSPLELLRNSPVRPHTFPFTPEFTNYRSEERAWRDSVALLEQSHHMTDLYVGGPDAERLLRDLGVNTFAKFPVDKAKQLVVCDERGLVIGDCICFHVEEHLYDLVGLPMAMDWVQFNAETGDYDVTVERFDNSAVRKGPPSVYRYEVQGPLAEQMMEKLTGGPLPELRFFTMGHLEIAGKHVRTMRHGIAGQPGFEMFGPWEDHAAVFEALVSGGEEFGMLQAGARAYSSTNLESGWIPAPLPAIFSDSMRPYREWLSAARAGSLGGSFVGQSIEDYHLTPYDLGYGRSVNFDHDFVGKEALQELKAAGDPPRTKVSLVWDADAVADVMASQFRPGTPAKHIELPKARYALYQADSVLVDGQRVGLSFDCGQVVNEQVFVSLAVVDRAVAEPGTRVSVVWGEDPITQKPQVEAHRQVEIPAIVAPAPLEQYAREIYRTQ